jgi:hypothetical protein
MHDPTQAARYMAASDPEDPDTKAETLLLQSVAALERGDAAAVLAPLQAFWTAWQAPGIVRFDYPDTLTIPASSAWPTGWLAV